MRLWKESRYDFFVVKKSGQKAYLKRELVRLRREWEVELDRVWETMGKVAYWKTVAPFVGCLVAGRVDQGRSEMALRFGVGVRGMVDESAEGYGNVKRERDGDGRNELLEGLKVPLYGHVTGGFEVDHETVVDLTAGLNAVKASTAKGMLTMLLELF